MLYPKKHLRQRNSSWLPNLHLGKDGVVIACAGTSTERKCAHAGIICQRHPMIEIHGKMEAKNVNAKCVFVERDSGHVQSVVAASLQKSSRHGQLHRQLRRRRITHLDVAMFAWKMVLLSCAIIGDALNVRRPSTKTAFLCGLSFARVYLTRRLQDATFARKLKDLQQRA